MPLKISCFVPILFLTIILRSVHFQLMFVLAGSIQEMHALFGINKCQNHFTKQRQYGNPVLCTATIVTSSIPRVNYFN